jgi:excinuclease ABC subunit C
MLLMFRDGRNLGTRSFFPKTNGEDSAEEVLGAFVSQYYAEQTPPREIVLDRDIPERDLIEEALGATAGRKVQIKTSVRGERAGYLDLVRRNAEVALAAEVGSNGARAPRRFAICSGLARCRSGSNASTSATPWARRRWLPAWCSMPMARCAVSTAATTSKV